MRKKHQDSRGFTLIAALLLTVLLSGMAVGLLFLVSNEVRMGGNDLEGNMAYYAAEAQIENLTSQLSQLYQSSQSPNAAAINALWTNNANWANVVPGSNIANVSYTSPAGISQIVWPATQSNGVACPNAPNPCGSWDIVGAGSDQGMVATVIPFTLTVTATRQAGTGQTSTDAAAATGSAVSLTRTVEVALLPAFEFGIFCDGDCDYFAGPPFNFGGRVHANGNLFLAANSGPLTFTDKLAAVGEVITDQLENGNKTGSGNYGGPVYIPNAAAGCPSAPNSGPGSGTNCIALPAGSWTGGFPPTGTPNYNPGPWTGISKSTYAGFVENGYTGATKLQLPFVNSSKVGAIDIIRKPTPGDTTLLASSRLYNQASIRILLADTQGDLYPGETRTDSSTQDIQIGTPFTNTTMYASVATAAPGVTTGNMYYATAQPHSGTNDWVTAPTNCGSPASWPLFGEVTVSGNLCKGAWLRVEYQNAAGQWTGITTQWLGYGFGRNYNQPPTHPYNASTATAPLCKNYPTYPAGQCQNGISPAILILQQLQSGMATTKAFEADTTDSSGTAYNWIPINFYDAREGEPRDTRPSGDPGTMCSPNGIMNTVELDAGNLWLWLQGVGPYSTGSGKLVTAANYNGYILYFSDHRGMRPDLYPLTVFNNSFSGMSGLNDVVNSSSSTGVPSGTLEPITYYATAKPTPYSPEDVAVKGAAVNLGHVDNWGQTYLGAGFGIPAASMNLPYYIYGTVTSNAVQCYSSALGTATAEWNMVTGPRHSIRLVDGGMDASGNSYLPPTNGTLANNGKGFTVASEEPVYVYGDYNTGSADPFWPSENTTTTPHSAAAIIADSVTLLSNPPANNTAPSTNTGWTDIESFMYPGVATSRNGNTSYYRMAIAAGKSIPFPQPSWGGPDMGTDGGMHNFLRYLENRGANGAVVNYAGSMISMYYSQYNTGIFKCCNSTYGAPTRNYFFDTQFLDPNNLPPGTPSFQDVVSLSYHQSFSTQ